MDSLVSYQLSEEQLALRDAVRSFVGREVRPSALERERIADPAQRVPWRWIETLSRMGVRTMPVPVEYGGAGADVLTTCLIGEELAAGDLGLAVIFDQTWKFIPLITTACSESQRDRYLPDFLADDRFLLALGLHEDGAGSDHFLPFNVAPHGGRATAVEQADGSWVLNGAKTYISNGGLAKLHIILARTQPGTGGVDGLSAFFVEPGTSGFSVGRIENKVGQVVSQNAELILNDCRVPAENLLGERHRGMRTLGRATRGRGMPQAAATCLGVARAAYESALDYARTRVQGGTEILNHDIIGLMLADMDLKIETARQLTWRAAWAVQNAERGDQRLAEMSKQYASDMAVEVCVSAMEIFGGAGVMLEQPAQKYVRDSLTFLHSEGTNQIMRMRRVNRLRGASDAR
jgi:alkylation response protein AidB-like acyl-CoA dehydrogenase